MTDLQRQFYDMLMRSQYWSAERMQEHQRGQLSQLLMHARRTVPFYANRLDAVFRPDGTIDWDRWTEIPILTRADLREHGEAMQASELPPGHGPTMVQSSSGSTGQPIPTTQAYLTAIASDAAMARAHTWHGINFDKRLLNLSDADPSKGQLPDGTIGGPWGPSFMPGFGEGIILNLDSSPAEQLAFIQRCRPDYLAGVPSRVRAVALEARRQGIMVPIEVVFTRAEGVTQAMRELFHAVFGARTIEMYSTQEAARIAHDCPDAPIRHVNAELVLVEIVDNAGRPCPEGVSGRVVLTPYFNTAQPLIRYEIGDVARLQAPCSCGRTLPVLSAIEGRVLHLFALPDGRRFVPNVNDGDVVALGVEAWQLAQVSASAAEFRYVAPEPVDKAKAASILRDGLLRELAIKVRRLEGFPPGRKHISYVNETDVDQTQR